MSHKLIQQRGKYSLLRPVTALICLLFCSWTLAEQLNANNQNSQLGFAGEHAGMAFSGKFNTWSAQLSLPPSIAPKISATFDLRSAKTGDRTYDETLPEGDWFDVENTPQGQFEATDITSTDNGYWIKGKLTLRGITQAIEFALLDTSKGLQANIKIDRLAFDIGKDSDPDAEWVSRYINLTLKISQ